MQDIKLKKYNKNILQKVKVNDKIKKYKRKNRKGAHKDDKGQNRWGSTHTHTNSFREIRKGEEAFINDIKNKINDRL